MRWEYTETTRNTYKITGAAGVSGIVSVPGTIGGIRVDEIGSRAFEGMTDITGLELPDGIRVIGSYAFYNCRNLRTLSMTDSTEELSDGAIRMCPNLSEVRIRMLRSGYRLIKELLGDTENMILLALSLPDGYAKLVFPGYYQEYREDPWARVIHQSIIGSGYSYRVCVSRKGIDFEEYDECFLRGEMAGDPAADKIALARLMYPYRISERALSYYNGYLEKHCGRILTQLVMDGDSEGCGFLVRTVRIPDDVFDQCLRIASSERETEITGILMEAAGGESQKNEPGSFFFDI